MITVDYIFV